MALWFGRRVSPPVVQTIRARNHALAVRIRALLIRHHLVPEQTPLAAFDLLVELGDRILEVAFRSPGPPDRQTIELGAMLAPASVVFTPPSHPVDLRDPYLWWSYVPGANWRHPGGPGTSLRGRLDYPVTMWRGRMRSPTRSGKADPH